METLYQSDRRKVNQRQLGQSFEKKAGAYLCSLGYEILEYNFRSRSGEIDIIAREEGTLVFVEVKYRKTGDTGFGQEAVGPGKQRNISRTAAYYLTRHGLSPDTDCRFDVVAINNENIELIRNAFYYRL